MFSTVRHGTHRTKGGVSRGELLGLIFKLTRSAEKASSGCVPERLAEAIAGVRLEDGVPENACQNQDIGPQQIAA